MPDKNYSKRRAGFLAKGLCPVCYGKNLARDGSNICEECYQKRSLTKHSEKPHEAREKIVRLMGDLPRIELFARRKFPGWDCWGDDVELDGPVLTTDLSLF